MDLHPTSSYHFHMIARSGINRNSTFPNKPYVDGLGAPVLFLNRLLISSSERSSPASPIALSR